MIFTAMRTATDVLCLTRPDLVRDAHADFFAAGADMVETNTFGASPLTLGEFGIGPQAYEINRRAGEIAREAAELFKGDGRRASCWARSAPEPNSRRWAMSTMRRWKPRCWCKLKA